MAMPKLESCLCFKLKNGGIHHGKCEIIIGFLCFIAGIVFYFIYIEVLKDLPKFYYLIYAGVNLCRSGVYVLWIYGMLKVKPFLLLPALIFSVINIFVVIPFLNTIIKVMVFGQDPDNIHDQNPSSHLLFCTFLLSLIAFNMYLFAVQYAVFKKTIQAVNKQKKELEQLEDIIA